MDKVSNIHERWLKKNYLSFDVEGFNRDEAGNVEVHKLEFIAYPTFDGFEISFGDCYFQFTDDQFPII